MRRFTLPLLLIPFLAIGVLAEPVAKAVDPVMEAIANPPATGMLVTSVVAETQALKLGVMPGDVLVTYNGVAISGLEQLAQVKQAAADMKSVKAVFARKTESFTVAFAPGSIGIHLIPVTKGVAPKLAPATDVRFDFKSLADKPRDDWYAFTFDGVKTVGFEHDRVRLVGGRIHIEREVAFDGGPQWGLNHFAVTVVATADPRPQMLRTSFFAPLLDIRSAAEVRRAADGTAEWFNNSQTKGEIRVHRFPMPEGMLSEYFVETLATLMPREKGACVRYRPVLESGGQLDLPAALVCAGEDEVEHGGKKVAVWRLERQQLGGMVAVKWFVDDSGRVLVADYGGVRIHRTTKEEALKGLNPKLLPLVFK